MHSISDSSNCGARAITVPVWSTTTEWPSNTSSSCPPTRLQNATAQRLSRARWISMRSRAKPFPASYGDADGLTSSSAPASASSDAGGPGTHRSSQMVSPSRRAAEVDHRGALAGLEVARLVGDAVVPQPRLAVRRDDVAVGDHGERVVDVLRALRVADHGDDALDVARDRVERLLGGEQEVLLEQQVLGRIARQHQLREQHQLGAGFARPRDVLAHEPRVALEVADRRVDLRERKGERCERAGQGADSVKRAAWGAPAARAACPTRRRGPPAPRSRRPAPRRRRRGRAGRRSRPRGRSRSARCRT